MSDLNTILRTNILLQISGPIPPAEIEFILSLATSFSPVTQLKAAQDAILYIAQLPDDKDG